MRKIIVSVAALLAATTGPTFAADLSARKVAAPEPSPPPAWTGFFVGVNAGYTWTQSNSINQNFVDTAPGGFATNALLGAIPFQTNVPNQGFIGGGQVGFNWQFDNRFVVGLEADLQALTGGDGTVKIISGNSATSFSRGIGEIGTVRARVGYRVAPTVLVYGSGGLAYGQGSLTGNYYGAWTPPVQLIDYETQTLTGFAAGGGVEWLFLPKWSFKAEYLYYDLGALTTTGVQYSYKTGGFQQISTAQSTTRFDGHIIRVGVNYHVNWGGPPSLFGKP